MKWKLLTQHYHMDALLEPGTIVGDGERFPWPEGLRPSLNMEPADAEAEAYLKEHPRKFEGKPIPAELLAAPPPIMQGQRVGGMGPKPDSAVQVPGQGPAAGSSAAIDHALVEKALNAPATDPNPFKT